MRDLKEQLENAIKRIEQLENNQHIHTSTSSHTHLTLSSSPPAVDHFSPLASPTSPPLLTSHPALLPSDFSGSHVSHACTPPLPLHHIYPQHTCIYHLQLPICHTTMLHILILLPPLTLYLIHQPELPTTTATTNKPKERRVDQLGSMPTEKCGRSSGGTSFALAKLSVFGEEVMQKCTPLGSKEHKALPQIGLWTIKCVIFRLYPE